MFGLPERKRFDNIYAQPQQQAEFGPPDFNGGMDVRSILDMILSRGRNAKTVDVTAQAHQTNNQLQEIARGLSQRPLEQQKNVQPQQQIKVLPATYNGMSAYENETINFKKRELEQKKALGEGGLDVKERGQDITKELGEKRIDSTNNINQQKVDISSRRADVYKWKAEHPNWVGKALPGGNLVFFNPQDPTQEIDSGISSGQMDEKDKIELLGKQKTDLSNVNSMNNLTEIATRAAESRRTNEEKPQLPSQDAAASNNKARELIAKNPAIAQYLVQDARGNYVSSAPEGSDAAKIINDVLFPRPSGFGKDINLPVEGSSMFDRTTKPAAITSPAKKEEEKAPPAPKGWKYVKKPGGGWTAVEDK